MGNNTSTPAATTQGLAVAPYSAQTSSFPAAAPYTAPVSTPGADPFLQPVDSAYSKNPANWMADTASLLCSDTRISASECA